MKKKIEEKEIMKLQNLSKEMEKINEKKQDGLELDKSDSDKRDEIKISEVLIRIDSKKRGDDDDLVDTDTDKETNKKE